MAEEQRRSSETPESAAAGGIQGASVEGAACVGSESSPVPSAPGASSDASPAPGRIEPTPVNPAPEPVPSVFIDEVHGHLRRYRKVVEFTHSATRAAGIMLLAAIAAIAIANSGVYEGFLGLIAQPVGVIAGQWSATMSVSHVINDILMAVFFLLVGLEIKYEMTVGELTNIRQALLPIVAACGGVLVPIAIYSAFNAGDPATSHGWGVPTATDIAFALGIMALLGDRIPSGVRVFLSTLAVADDIIAIIVIAVFYGHSPDPVYVAAAALVYAGLILMNRSHVYSTAPYLLAGGVLWLFVFLSGVHSTIAGVLLAFVIPSGSRINLSQFAKWTRTTLKKADDNFEPNEPVIGQKDYITDVSRVAKVARQVVPPATRLEHRLYPWVYFAILPLFALTNADVSLVGVDANELVGSTIFFGVFFGLLVGKPVGIMLFSAIVVKTGLASLPENVNWRHMLGAAILGGVGFTMAIFVANLAFETEAAVTTAKAAILAASALAGVIGFGVLLLEARADANRGVAYVRASSGENLSYADEEGCQASEETIDELDDESRSLLDLARLSERPREIVAHLRDWAIRDKKE